MDSRFRETPNHLSKPVTYQNLPKPNVFFTQPDLILPNPTDNYPSFSVLTFTHFDGYIISPEGDDQEEVESMYSPRILLTLPPAQHPTINIRRQHCFSAQHTTVKTYYQTHLP